MGNVLRAAERVCINHDDRHAVQRRRNADHAALPVVLCDRNSALIWDPGEICGIRERITVKIDQIADLYMIRARRLYIG